MKTYTLQREQLLPISIDEAWAFFSTPANLSEITPPEMQFEILSDVLGKPIFNGMRINYFVRPLLNIKMKWTTEITGVDAPHMFTDRQERGPYSLWEHTHTFVPAPGGTLMTDQIKYALPLGILGSIMHGIVVEKKLKNIFDFRAKKLAQLFGKQKK
jgi:ligand-binding SRPBCC domain-containing protein